MQGRIKKGCISVLLATSMITTNARGLIMAHESSENLDIQVKGMSYDGVISDELRGKLDETDVYVDTMVYFKDDTSKEDIQDLSEMIKLKKVRMTRIERQL